MEDENVVLTSSSSPRSVPPRAPNSPSPQTQKKKKKYEVATEDENVFRSHWNPAIGKANPAANQFITPAKKPADKAKGVAESPRVVRIEAPPAPPPPLPHLEVEDDDEDDDDEEKKSADGERALSARLSKASYAMKALTDSRKTVNGITSKDRGIHNQFQHLYQQQQQQPALSTSPTSGWKCASTRAPRGISPRTKREQESQAIEDAKWEVHPINTESTPLISAIWAGNIIKAKNILDASPSSLLDLAAPCNHSVLAIACKCYAGDLGFIKTLVERGADINASCDKGKTPLHDACAARSGDKPCSAELISYLLENGADLNAKDRLGITPLGIAIRTGYLNITSALLAKGAIPDVRDNEGWTPLMRAAYFGHDHLINKLMEVHPNLDLLEEANNGSTALLAAILGGNASAVSLLLQYFSQTNESISTFLDKKWKKNNATPLWLASSLGYDKITQILLSKGADVNAAANTGESPLYIAVEEENESVAHLLLDYGADMNQPDERGTTPFWFAAGNGRDRLVTRMLSMKGVDVNFSPGNNGLSPLICAANEGHERVVQLLLQHPDTQVNMLYKGVSALGYSIQQNKTKVVSLLLKHVPQVSLTAFEGGEHRSPLALAVEYDRDDIFKLLLNAFVMTSTPISVYALSLATKKGKAAFVELMLKAGSNPNQTPAHVDDSRKQRLLPPLHEAAKRGDLTLATLLIQNGAELGFLTPSKVSPLALAVYAGSEPIVQLFLEKGANPFLTLHTDQLKEFVKITPNMTGIVSLLDIALQQAATQNNSAPYKKIATMLKNRGVPSQSSGCLIM